MHGAAYPSYVFIICLCICICFSCKKNEETVSPFPSDNDLAGGIYNTSYDFSSNAFGNPCTSLSDSALNLHKKGDQFFDAAFVSAPAILNPGLGPLFNANSCGSCHANDGKGSAPVSGEAISSLLFRLSIQGTDINGAPNPIPGFGTQLQNKAIVGVMPEGKVSISYSDSVLSLVDGSTVTLRKPAYTFNTYTELPGNFMFSPRIAPANFGLGLLEAIDEKTILSNADEFDSNGDGISGRPNYVYDIAANMIVMGRFGWKANQPNIKQQVAGAFNGDMGITSSLVPVKNCSGQPQCDGVSAATATDITDTQLNAVAFYLQSLAVPARRNVQDDQVQKGKLIFNQAKCNVCHISNIRTGISNQINLSYLSLQDIQPFTDLLLHDMGPALADNRPDFVATGTEWRTPPLWGIGLQQIVNGNTVFLHDGRARNLMEAIMWHGGEAENSKQYIRTLSKGERDALITFLQSL